MGVMTLEEFRSELSLNLTGHNPDNTRLTLWVNFGYLNLCSYVTFDELRKLTDFNVVEGTIEYAAPTDLLGTVTIEIEGKRLLKAQRRFPEPEEPGFPHSYIRREANYIIWPEPDDDYEGTLEYIKTPARLSVSTDLTVLPANWDVGVLMLATHHGFLALGQQEDADRWLGRFLGYSSSRIKEQDISADVPHGGLNVAWVPEDLIETPPHYEGTDNSRIESQF